MSPLLSTRRSADTCCNLLLLSASTDNASKVATTSLSRLLTQDVGQQVLRASRLLLRLQRVMTFFCHVQLT